MPTYETLDQALSRIGWKPSDGRHRCGVHFETAEDRMAAEDKFFEDMADNERGC
jgi:hypothetical protein